MDQSGQRGIDLGLRAIEREAAGTVAGQGEVSSRSGCPVKVKNGTSGQRPANLYAAFHERCRAGLRHR